MSARPANVYAVVLAAGASRRLGAPKQLLKWVDRALLEHALFAARAVAEQRCIAVLGCHADAIRKAVCFETVTVVDNPDWQEGIASSIRTGIRALPDSAEAALIMLADQPLIEAGHLRALLNASRTEPGRIVAGFYRGGAGVPALFPVKYFAHLTALEGDSGAKALLKAFDAEVLKMPLPAAEFDIDCLEDFERLTKCR